MYDVCQKRLILRFCVCQSHLPANCRLRVIPASVWSLQYRVSIVQSVAARRLSLIFFFPSSASTGGEKLGNQANGRNGVSGMSRNYMEMMTC